MPFPAFIELAFRWRDEKKLCYKVICVGVINKVEEGIGSVVDCWNFGKGVWEHPHWGCLLSIIRDMTVSSVIVCDGMDLGNQPQCPLYNPGQNRTNGSGREVSWDKRRRCRISVVMENLKIVWELEETKTSIRRKVTSQNTTWLCCE